MTFTVDILRTVEAAQSELADGFSISVRIPDDDSIPTDADGERDYGNADWPTDEAIAAEVERQIRRAVAVKFFDKGDDLCEGIYHVTTAVHCATCGSLLPSPTSAPGAPTRSRPTARLGPTPTWSSAVAAKRPEGRPSLSGKGDTASFPVRLSPALVRRVKARSVLLGISRAELVRRALEAWLA